MIFKGHRRKKYQARLKFCAKRRPDMKTRKEKGFTRADALVTIMVITVIVTTSLAAIVPAMNKARQAALRAQCADNLRQISAAIAVYADAYDNWLPFYGGWDPNFESPYKCNICLEEQCYRTGGYCPQDQSAPYAAFRRNEQWCRNGNLDDPYPLKLGCLYRAGVVTDARIFYCPANTEQMFKYDSYVNPYPPNTSYEWGTLPQKVNNDYMMTEWVRLGYIYFPVDSNMPREFDGLREAPIATARKFDKLDPAIPYLVDMLYFREQISHKTENGYSVNAAFKDGHVVYCKDRRFFSVNPVDDPMQLWYLWDGRKIKFNYFYYNFLKKIQP
jgi:type II secretory pathway pseudopilin PulG